ncbi:TetR/AcrR family transcriptional regulator [Curtobacterium sp. MCBA15_008]|uniref:TetR/AcrR family transcriptional regulator n=1 Tax=Curtobacterium sp. MCBA15_008 TaxID=1898736 RepID=UPI0009F4A3B5|nr:TetR family transcriptional regulator C-terminal domain-containing protein [Curtobacterium sp. MCBA15_008]
MGRNLDVEARQRAVLEASWRVIARDGVAALTVRAVAAEAGIAPSSLRYTFPTQASVREHAISAVGERLGTRIAALPKTGDPALWARSALLELLPLDSQRLLEMEVFLALSVAALTSPELQDMQTTTNNIVRDVCARAVAAVEPNADDTAVQLVHAVIDGLALHLIQSPTGGDPGWSAQVIDRCLESVR